MTRAGLFDRKGGALARLAGQLCTRTDFQRWVESVAGGTPCGVSGAGNAADYVRRVCGVSSRAELDHRPAAAAAFHEKVRRPFLAHMDAKQTAWATDRAPRARVLYCGFELNADGNQAARGLILNARHGIGLHELGKTLEAYMVPVEPWKGVEAEQAARAAAEDALWRAEQAGVLRKSHRGMTGAQVWKRVK